MEILNKIDLFQKDINELRPFEGGMLGQIQDYYRVGLTWTSNALEGNSLTESETKVLLEDGSVTESRYKLSLPRPDGRRETAPGCVRGGGPCKSL